MTADWDDQFNEIASNLKMEWGVEPTVGVEELNHAIMSLNEVATFLSRLMAKGMQDPNELLFLNEGLAEGIHELILLSDAITVELCGCDCPECQPCECDDESNELCESCKNLYEIDDDDDEDF